MSVIQPAGGLSGGIESAPSVPSIIKPARSKDAYKWQLLDWGRDTFDSSGSEATLIAAGGAGGAKIGSVITAALSGGAALAEGAAEGAAGGAVVGPWGALAGAAIGAAVTAGGIYLAKDMAAEYEDTHRFNVASDKDSIIASAAKFMKDNGILQPKAKGTLLKYQNLPFPEAKFGVRREPIMTDDGPFHKGQFGLVLPGTGRTPDGKSIPTARTATDADYASIGAPNPRNGKLLNGLTRGINIGGAIAGVAGNVASLFGPGGHKVGSRINGYNDAFQKIGSLVVPASNMLRGFVPKGGSAGNKMMQLYM